MDNKLCQLKDHYITKEYQSLFSLFIGKIKELTVKVLRTLPNNSPEDVEEFVKLLDQWETNFVPPMFNSFTKKFNEFLTALSLEDYE